MRAFLPPAALRELRRLASSTMQSTCELRRMPTDRTAETLTPATAPLIATTIGNVTAKKQASFLDDEGRAVTRVVEQVALPYDVVVERRDYLLIDGRVLRVIAPVEPSETQRAQTLVAVEEVE